MLYNTGSLRLTKNTAKSFSTKTPIVPSLFHAYILELYFIKHKQWNFRIERIVY